MNGVRHGPSSRTEGAAAAHRGFGTASVQAGATACLIDGSPAAEVASIPAGNRKTLSVEHPTGETTCVMELDDSGAVISAAMLRTARKLMDGEIFA